MLGRQRGRIAIILPSGYIQKSFIQWLVGICLHFATDTKICVMKSSGWPPKEASLTYNVPETLIIFFSQSSPRSLKPDLKI